MDTKEIKKYLMKYAGLKMKVQNQTERIIRARNNTLIPAIRQGDGSQRQPGGTDRLGSVLTRALDLEERLLPSIEESTAQMREIEAAVDGLEDSFESEVLRLRYLDCCFIDDEGEEHRCQMVPWKYVSMNIYGDDDEKHLQATYRLHGRALQSIGKVIMEHEANEVDL